MNTCNTGAMNLQDLIARAPAPLSGGAVIKHRVHMHVELIMWLTGCSDEAAAQLRTVYANPGPFKSVRLDFASEFAQVDDIALHIMSDASEFFGTLYGAGLIGLTFYGAEFVIPAGIAPASTRHRDARAAAPFKVRAVDHRLTGELWARAQAALVLQTLTGVGELQNTGNPCGEIAL